MRKQVDDGLSKLYSTGVIDKLTIRNGKYGAIDKSFDSLIVEDSVILEEIRGMMLGIKGIDLTKHSPKWTARMEFTLNDKTNFEIWLNKTDAPGDGEYKIYIYGDCEESYARGSKVLGEKIVGLIRRGKMTIKITSESQYRAVMKTIETLLEKATQLGGSHKLSIEECTTLADLSKVVEVYEDSVLKLMPILPKRQ